MKANRPLRGYMVSGREPSEGAVLVFAQTARAAKLRGWDAVSEWVDDYMDLRVRWLREATPQAWGVAGPCVLRPRVCVDCELWYAEGPVVDGRCVECRDLEECFPVLTPSALAALRAKGVEV